MIEIRRLNRRELNELINDAPELETRNMKRLINGDYYTYFDTNCRDHFGLISNGRPIYMAALSYNNEFWTIVNSNVSEKISLCKYCKRELKLWIEKFGDIYATMEKIAPLENIKWVKWLGFKVDSEHDNLITFKIS